MSWLDNLFSGNQEKRADQQYYDDSAEDQEEDGVDLPLPEIGIPQEGSHLCKMCHPWNDFASGYCDRHDAQMRAELWDQFNRGF